MAVRILEVFGEPIVNGGQESLVFNIIQNMDTTGLDINVLTLYYCENKRYEEIIEDMGGSIISFNLPFAPGKSRSNLCKPLFKYLRSEKYDVLHIHSGSISVLALSAAVAKRAGIKKIFVHSHCAAERKTLRYRIVKLIMSPLMILYPTDYLACSQIAGEWKYPRAIVKNKMRILKNGVEIDKFVFDKKKRDIFRKQLGIENKDFVIGHVGRFSYQKNQEFLIELFEEVKKKEKNSKLLLIGNGETIEKIKGMVKRIGFEKDVFFIGNVNNVNDYLHIMDVFVLPSRYEGLPIVGVEAQAAGLPILVSANVSKELKITECVQYIDLKDKADWVQLICAQKGKDRVQTVEQIRSAGYDIKMTAKYLRKLYLQIEG